MIRSLSLAGAFALTALPGLALDLDKMTDEEREVFRAEVRSYLLDNPEVIMEAVDLLQQREAQAEAAHDLALVKAYSGEIFDDGYSYVGGNPDGDITLVEFVDYRCGYCRKAHEEVKQLVENDGNIRLIYKELPILGEASVLSSRFAVAVKQVAGSEAYAMAHDALISMTGEPSPTALSRLADALGLDATAVLAHMDSAEVTDEIRATRALAQKLSISGTPTFVMQDQLLRGYLPLNTMTALVEEKRG
ncbi:DsbA family protein [uncultured Shimia sp.]|uniref:DsbA family protein n=1 Tax=uncultured Shimia sp. TaxID=573152 RepID=UPI00260DE505|nr:DsbA family protein [uncultured Shimia sp.]